ncbi:MAG: acyl-CoA dehydrogenase family protein [Planctomycetota bacterium]|jgi:alkylation response protein AidB-like acyl-CoA dehydrogenase
MDFAVSEEMKFFRKAVADMVEKVVKPKAEALDEKDDFDRELFEEIGKLGYYGLRYPENVGGMEVDTPTFAVFLEEMARGSFGMATAVMMQCLMGTHFLHAFGSDDIIERLFKPAIRGEKIGCIAFTEDRSGSDITGTRTIAKKDGDDWILNGRKMWITNGPIADFVTVLATTDPAKKTKGLNFFLIEKGMKGFEAGQILHKLGARGTITGELILDDVRVPADHLLGKEVDKGMDYMLEVLDEIRCMTAALALGLARAALEDAREYARAREAFGRPIGKFQLIASKFGECTTELEAATLMVQKVAWLVQNKIPCRNEAAMAKMFATEMCLKAVDEATRIYGGNAFATEYPVQRYFRDARFLLYGGGTHEVLKNFLGSQYIGKI